MKSSRSSLFLMELIISILFFSIASAACIQLFVKAHLLDQKTQEQNQALIWSQNLSVLWLAAEREALSTDGDSRATERVYSVYLQLEQDYGRDDGSIYLSNDGKHLSLSFDRSWNLCAWADSSQPTYIITLSDYGYDTSTQLISAEISCKKENNAFYTLPLVHHPAMERRASHE